MIPLKSPISLSLGKGRYKVMDKTSRDDMSGYNAAFGGSGGPKMRNMGGKGKNRMGKRARDAKRRK